MGYGVNFRYLIEGLKCLLLRSAVPRNDTASRERHTQRIAKYIASCSGQAELLKKQSISSSGFSISLSLSRARTFFPNSVGVSILLPGAYLSLPRKRAVHASL